MTLANGTDTELKGNEAWLFNLEPVPCSAGARATVAGPSPGVPHRGSGRLLTSVSPSEAETAWRHCSLKNGTSFVALRAPVANFWLGSGKGRCPAKWQLLPISACAGMVQATSLAVRQNKVRAGCSPAGVMRVLVHHGLTPQGATEVQVSRLANIQHRRCPACLAAR